MIESHTLDGSESPSGYGFWICLLVVAVVSFLAISADSLWIDEALSAVKAREPDLAGWWGRMVGEKASDLQMPLYMIYLWAWAKMVGSGEWALRAGNLPWMLAGAGLFLYSLKGRQSGMAALVISTCPFAWYCLNEARPYAMQLGAALAVIAALRALAKRTGGKDSDSGDRHAEGVWLGVLLAGIIALSGSSLLGMIWALAAIPALVLPRGQCAAVDLLKRHPLQVCLGLVLLGGLGGYYLWTLKSGARASATASTDAKTLLFDVYELTGFGGIGPGRLTLREQGMHSLSPHLAGLFLYAVGLTGAAFGVARFVWMRCERRLSGGLLLSVVLPTGLLVGAAMLLHFRLLGRHLTPMEAVWIALLTLGLGELWSNNGKRGRLLTVGFLVLSLASCLLLRWAPRHQKDDYRGAARMAKEALAKHQTVWWNAAREGAAYYGIEEAQEDGRLIYLMNPTGQDLSEMPPADVIISSKPDVYDVEGAVSNVIGESEFEKETSLQAFTIWHRLLRP